jgi:hypothetical protein
MVIDVANVRDIGPKLGNRLSQPAPGVGGVNGVRGQLSARKHPQCVVFEVDVWKKPLSIGRGFRARIGHGKQSHLVTSRTQEMHEFEQVDFGPTERKTVFIAE